LPGFALRINLNSSFSVFFQVQRERGNTTMWEHKIHRILLLGYYTAKAVNPRKTSLKNNWSMCYSRTSARSKLGRK
jgi:hypothetical protein